MMSTRPTAVITGASSGIGEATARRLADDGFAVVVGARRAERIEALATELAGAHGRVVDVMDEGSMRSFAADVACCDVLVCNAGGGLGLEPIVSLEDDAWRAMWETHVLGVVRTVRSLMPSLRASASPRVVVVTSAAGREVYSGGAGYTSAKHAEVAVVDTLRLELVAEGIQVLEVSPGVVDTELPLVRLAGDTPGAQALRRGIEPLRATDVADAIAFAVTRPPNVAITRVDIFPSRQVAAAQFHRERDA